MSPDRVIPGQVVQADDDNDEQARPQETFLHKVASGPLGPVGASMTGRHARMGGTGLRDEDNDPAVMDTDDEAYVMDTDDDTEVMPAMGATAATASSTEVRDTAETDDTTTVDDVTEADAADPYPAETADPYPAETDSPTVDVAAVDAAEAGVPVFVPRTEVVDDADIADVQDTDTDIVGTPDGTTTSDDSDVTETMADMPVVQAPAAPAAPAAAGADADADADEPLLGQAADGMREQWRQVQASFVDDPHASVMSAAGVVADAAARLEAMLRERQRSLRSNWDGNGQADTETLRQLMLTYRRLLTKLIS
jgi:hypothetical protein